jgi:plastocyanin
MRRLALATVVTLVSLGGPASAQMGHDMGHAEGGEMVSILFGGYAPARIDVLAGDTVQWQNDSLRAHTVSADDGAWGSARLAGSSGFSHRFDTPDVATYYCTLHTFMRGEVDVHRVLLTAPSEPGAPGRPYTLRGRAALPAGQSVTLQADTGAGFQQVGTATVADDGTFTADVKPTATASYRASAGTETSQTVQLLVLDRKLTAKSMGQGRRVTVDARVAPASPHAPVVLQLRLPQRFGWWPVARARLDHHSRAHFKLKLAHRYPARVVLTLADGATALATSRTLHIGPR